jgi:hypothetical protein
MKKSKFYYRARFTPEVIQKASTVLTQRADLSPRQTVDSPPMLTVRVDDEEWTHDSEPEFFADYRRGTDASYTKEVQGASLRIFVYENSTAVEVSAKDRSIIQEVFDAFETHLSESLLAELVPSKPKQPIVFIGHGRSPLWRELKNHLQDKHGYRVEA